MSISHVILQVALVNLSPRVLPGFLFHGKDLSAEMLKSGWSVTYAQVFPRNSNNHFYFFDVYFNRLAPNTGNWERRAIFSCKLKPSTPNSIPIILKHGFDLVIFFLFSRVARRGIWKYGKNAETPAEYKRRYAMPPDAVSNASTNPPSTTTKRRSKKKNWWNGLFS